MNRSVDVGYVWVGFHDAYMSSMFARKDLALQRLIVFVYKQVFHKTVPDTPTLSNMYKIPNLLNLTHLNYITYSNYIYIYTYIYTHIYITQPTYPT